jgi:hypothetical protein
MLGAGAILETMRDFLIGTAVVLVITATILITWNATAYRDVDYLKEVAPEYIEKAGFAITMYEGYQGGYIHGGSVWYQARDTSGYLYTMEVKEWRGELHLYNITCLNAVTNN